MPQQVHISLVRRGRRFRIGAAGIDIGLNRCVRVCDTARGRSFLQHCLPFLPGGGLCNSSGQVRLCLVVLLALSARAWLLAASVLGGDFTSGHCNRVLVGTRRIVVGLCDCGERDRADHDRAKNCSKTIGTHGIPFDVGHDLHTKRPAPCREPAFRCATRMSTSCQRQEQPWLRRMRPLVRPSYRKQRRMRPT